MRSGETGAGKHMLACDSLVLFEKGDFLSVNVDLVKGSP